MTNSLSLKKAFSFVVAAATIVSTAGLAAFAPVQASAAQYGDLIKGETLSTVYYYGSDGQRYAFPNEKTYFSWYADFSDVETISDEELADITLGGNIVYRPGSRWIKITSDDKVYAVSTDGSIHWVESEEVATGLAGSDWNQFIDDVPDVFFVDYTVGNSLTDASEGYDGMMWTDGSDMYLVWDDMLHEVTEDGADDNMMQNRFWLDGTGFDMDSLEEGMTIDREYAWLTDAAQMVDSDTYEETQEISVSLASTSPAATTLIAGQGIAHVASYRFTNSTSQAVDVTSVSIDRTGVSSDTTLSNVYLFDGWLRTSDAATVSSGTVTWNDSTGLFTIPANGSKTIDIRTDIASSTSGQTLGVELNSGDVEFDGAYVASASGSLTSATHTIAAAPSNFATVSFASTTTPSGDGSPEPQDDFRVWENVVSVGANEVWLQALRFRNIGSVDAEDVQDWTLYVAGVERGETVEMEDEDGYIEFDLSDNPVELNTGNHTVKLQANLVGGSTRTVSVSLRTTADAVFVEGDYDQPVLVQANSSTFSPRSAAAQTIASGNLTFTKKSNSPSGDVTNNSSNVTLGTWEARATGEAMKVESLNFNVSEDDSHTAFTLRNGAVYVDGKQVGSTTALCGNDTTTSGACTSVGGSGASYTTYTFGSSFVVYPGSPATMELRADLYDSTGTNDVANADTIQATIDGSSSSNVMRMTSGGYITAPSTDVTANILTVTEGTVTVAKNTSYSDQSVVVPKTEQKVGSWTITASTTEDVTLTQIDVDFDADDDGDAALATADYTNLYIEYGPEGDEVTSTVKSTVSTANSWSIDYELEKGEIIYVNAYANVAAGAADSADGSDFIKAELDVAGTAPDSGASVSASDVEGQTIYYGNSGSFTEYNASHPTAKVVAGNQEVQVAQYRFAATNENYTIKDLTTSVASATVATAIAAVNVYDGSTKLASTVYDENSNTRATFTDLNVSVPANTSKTLTITYTLNNIGTGAGSSQSNVANTLYSVVVADSQGTETTETSGSEFSSVNGNAVYVYKSVPTVSRVDLTNSTFINGQATDIYKFTVTASSQGNIALKQLALPLSWTDGGEADTLELESFKLYKNGVDVSTSSSAVVLQDNGGADVESTTGIVESETTLYVIWDTNEETISAGETVTYTIRATPTGFDSDGDTGEEDYVSIYLAGDTSAHNGGDICLEDAGSGDIWQLDEMVSGACTAASQNNSAYNFIWSDLSGSAHAGATETGSGDWANGYLVLNLDLEGETWFK